jgi:hypothetical protein
LVKYISELHAAQIEECYKVRPHCGFITASNVKATDRSFWDTVFTPRLEQGEPGADFVDLGDQISAPHFESPKDSQASSLSISSIFPLALFSHFSTFSTSNMVCFRMHLVHNLLVDMHRDGSGADFELGENSL